MRSKRRYLYFFVLLIVLLTSLLWVVKIMNGSIPYVDQSTRDFVEGLTDSNLYVFLRWVTELGSSPFLTSFTIIMGIVLWVLHRHLLVSLMFIIGTVFSHLFNVIIKVIVERERPRIFVAAEAEEYSFPSGHAMVSMVCYGLFVYFLTKKIKSFKIVVTLQISFSLLIFLIGLSRYIRVHYLTDVLAGFVFGFVFLIGWIRLYEWILRRQNCRLQS